MSKYLSSWIFSYNITGWLFETNDATIDPCDVCVVLAIFWQLYKQKKKEDKKKKKEGKLSGIEESDDPRKDKKMFFFKKRSKSKVSYVTLPHQLVTLRPTHEVKKVQKFQLLSLLFKKMCVFFFIVQSALK